MEIVSVTRVTYTPGFVPRMRIYRESKDRQAALTIALRRAWAGRGPRFSTACGADYPAIPTARVPLVPPPVRPRASRHSAGGQPPAAAMPSHDRGPPHELK